MARYAQLQKKDIREIAGNYDLALIKYEPIEGGAGNSSYLLRTRQGNYVLTVFDDKAPAYVVRMGQLLLLLAEYEFPTTPLLPPTKGGIISMYTDKPVMLKAYIAGQVVKDLDETMLCQVGAAMARLHQLPAPDFLPDKHPYGLQVFSNVIGQNINPDYETWLAKRLAYLEEHIPPGLPYGLIHGDLFYDNVLFEEKKLKAIIDFEEACRYYKGFDLGMGILGLCAENTTVMLEKARALVKGYQQIRMLEKREKDTLLLLVEYAAIATSCWRFWKYHIHTPLVAKADEHRQMMHLAEDVATIPKARFGEVVFG